MQSLPSPHHKFHTRESAAAKRKCELADDAHTARHVNILSMAGYSTILKLLHTSNKQNELAMDGSVL